MFGTRSDSWVAAQMISLCTASSLKSSAYEQTVTSLEMGESEKNIDSVPRYRLFATSDRRKSVQYTGQVTW